MKNKTTILALLLIAMTAIAIPVSGQKNLEKANEMMERFEYRQAIDYFEKYFVLHPPSSQNLRDISYCHLAMNDSENALKWLKKLAAKKDATARDVLMYASILKTEGLYDEAIIQYELIASKWPAEKDEAMAQAAACRNAVDWINNPLYFDVANASVFNSSNSDFGISPFGDKFIITSDRKNKELYSEKELHGWTGNPYYKLYTVDPANDGKTAAVESLNADYHNGPGVYNSNGSSFYFTRTKSVKIRQQPQNPDPTSWYKPPHKELYTNRLEIYSAQFLNGAWTAAAPFAYNNPDEYSVGHPALSPDGKRLYFASDMPGGMGGSDIYFCEIQADGSWGKPRNAGAAINTKGKELFPTFDSEGKLYFSSDGHPGMGGLDLFSAIGSGDSWSEVSNLRYPINSPKDDFSILFTEAGKQAYFASNRKGGMGSDDIYSLVYSPPVKLIMAVRTFEKFDGALLPLPYVNIDIASKDGNENYSLKTGDNSLGYHEVSCNEYYIVKGQLENHFAQSTEVQTECSTKQDTVWVDVVLERIVINRAIVLKNIYYDFDKWNIRPDAALELDKLVTILIDNPEIIVELGSHTDSRGSFKYNETLSQRRAESAVAYIISKGIEPDRISAKGYGESVPVNGCVDGVKCSEEDFQMNRRTEFKVTGYKSGLVRSEP